MKKMLGVMLDCSRNAVLKPDTVKKYADIIKKMGYNTLMLYTEDTYEIPGHPFFGHLRGRYSMDELKEIDAYCVSIGIELVPCIQTLAHLETIFKWGAYSEVNDCDNILLVGEDKTYALIETMLSTCAECFSSKKIHIGMDEAYRVGTGKYQQLHGLRDRFDIINEHLHKVCDIATKYNLEPMIWSDMFLKLAQGTEDQYNAESSSKILEKAELPENVSLVYWDYYSTDYDRYARNIKTNKLFGRKVYFAGGAWTWKGFAPDNSLSIKNTEVALKACQTECIDGMFFTVWGDDGAECSPFTILPSLMFAAEKANGNSDMDSIKKKFKSITGCDFDSFMLLDKLDSPEGKHAERWSYYAPSNPSKYLLYNDMFMGTRDFRCSPEDSTYYENLAREIKNAPGKGDFKYIFDSYEKLASVLEIKSTLGIRTRDAYLKKDIDALKTIIIDGETLLVRLEEFHTAHQTRWFTDNKPHGFDVQDIRLGGLIQRIKSCKDRLEKFVNGEISEIPELDEPVLDKINGYPWGRLVTPNSLSSQI